MNELNQKLELIYDAADTHREGIKAISKFFLEEIKEAWRFGRGSIDRNGNTLETIDDYLKSKYKI